MDILKIAKSIVSRSKTLTGSMTLVVEFPYGSSDAVHAAIQSALTSAAPQLTKIGVKVKEIHSERLRDAEMDFDDNV